MSCKHNPLLKVASKPLHDKKQSFRYWDTCFWYCNVLHAWDIDAASCYLFTSNILSLRQQHEVFIHVQCCVKLESDQHFNCHIFHWKKLWDFINTSLNPHWHCLVKENHVNELQKSFKYGSSSIRSGRNTWMRQINEWSPKEQSGGGNRNIWLINEYFIKALNVFHNQLYQWKIPVFRTY